MSLSAVQNPFVPFLGANGLALTAGAYGVYVGAPNTDPQTSPQAVYWDAAGTIPATQPLQLVGGYVIRNGAVAVAYTSGDYSMRIRNGLGVQVFYTATSLQVTANAGMVITNGASSDHAALLVEQYATGAGLYGIESHVYPGAQGNVFHHYSDATTAFKIDNVSNQSVITLNNTENAGVRPGVRGNGVFITFGGYGDTTPTVHSIIGVLSNKLQFASYDPLTQFNFTTGVIASAGVAETNRALTVAAFNTGYAATITGTDAGLFITTTVNGGVAALAIDKTGTGAGVAAFVVNRGTGNTLELSNGVTSGIIVSKDQKLGIGSTPGAYSLAATQAGVNAAYFGSTGAFDVQVQVNCDTAGQAAQIILLDHAVAKWTLSKQADNTFAILDTSHSRTLLKSASAGDLIIPLQDAVTPASNRDLGFYRIDDTHLGVKMKGNDGTVRSASIVVA